MAISKILHMKDCGISYHGRHLKRTIDYVKNPDKTQGGKLVGAINCQADNAYSQMTETKKLFGKVDKRQGYHIILSFKEDEVNPDTAFEITRKFVEEYLGKEYEAVYVVHDNTAHIHSHIVFNSVSFVDGKKYRYEKGDWEKYIQPITNKLCREYGLSIIDLEDGNRQKDKEDSPERNVHTGENKIWSDMIKRDVDASILQAATFDDFLELLQDKGYEIKHGKYLAIKPQGMSRFRRCRTLGYNYSEEILRERIKKENYSFYQSSKKIPNLVKCHIKSYKRAKMSGLQKKYYAKLYRTGQLKKKPYSKAWMYRDEIKKMKMLQQQYLFLSRHEIYTVEELVGTVDNLQEKKDEASSEQSRINKAMTRFKTLFSIYDELHKIEPAEKCFSAGDEFFINEHRKWQQLSEKIKSEGYSYEEIKKLKESYESMYSEACSKKKTIHKELSIGKSILKDLYAEDSGREKVEEKTREYDRKEKQI